MARAEEVDQPRFAFGKNWLQFLATVTEDSVRASEAALLDMLGRTTLDGLRFLDVGSGSGLSSLAAVRQGASVVSLDYDPHSVRASLDLKERWEPAADWVIRQGSILDKPFLESLGRFDIVYSWGVLHHTGSMWEAIVNASDMVATGGRFFISIYNDQGYTSRIWTEVKRAYVEGSPATKQFLLVAARSFFRAKQEAGWVLSWSVHIAAVGKFAVSGRPRRTKERMRERGMSRTHDMIDWVGGYPFEVAKPEEIFQFVEDRGFKMTNLKTCAGGIGCNQFVFELSGGSAAENEVVSLNGSSSAATTYVP